jgi:hypothetical protein
VDLDLYATLLHLPGCVCVCVIYVFLYVEPCHLKIIVLFPHFHFVCLFFSLTDVAKIPSTQLSKSSDGRDILVISFSVMLSVDFCMAEMFRYIFSIPK